MLLAFHKKHQCATVMNNGSRLDLATADLHDVLGGRIDDNHPDLHVLAPWVEDEAARYREGGPSNVCVYFGRYVTPLPASAQLASGDDRHARICREAQPLDGEAHRPHLACRRIGASARRV
jgi:hypothetical protein